VTAKTHPRTGDYVVILHGIARNRRHMSPLAVRLSAHGYDVINLDYPSTKHPLPDLIAFIDQTLARRLTHNKTVHYIGYSMGGCWCALFR
jgi:alpha-beta hydrolase superfamily lysophospholipase